MLYLTNQDITKLKIDVIVNAARPSLLGGGGVDGAIHRAAGNGLLEECKLLGGCSEGDVKITKAYDLNAKYVFHTVGPRWMSGFLENQDPLYNCYDNCLEKLNTLNLLSIAFPNISTGAYGFPKELACEIAINSSLKKQQSLNRNFEIIFCCFDNQNFDLYLNFLEQNQLSFSTNIQKFI